MMSKFIFCDREWGGTKAFHLEGLVFSRKFCDFFSDAFTDFFVRITGLRPSSKVTLAGYKQQNNTPIYQPGSVSKLNLVLWIMPEYNDNISFCWKSKKESLIKPTDENFDVTDIEYWIEGLKPAEYWREVGTEKKTHPFRIDNLHYDLKVFAFGMDMELRIYAKSEYQEIKECIANTIQVYNDTSEANNRKNGIAHNFSFEEEKDFLCFRIDTGSTGIEMIKKILKSLTKNEKISKVEIDV